MASELSAPPYDAESDIAAVVARLAARALRSLRGRTGAQQVIPITPHPERTA